MIKIVTNQQNHLNISQCSSRTHSLTNSIRNKPWLVLNNFSILQEVLRNELVWLGPVLRILWWDDWWTVIISDWWTTLWQAEWFARTRVSWGRLNPSSATSQTVLCIRPVGAMSAKRWISFKVAMVKGILHLISHFTSQPLPATWSISLWMFSCTSGWQDRSLRAHLIITDSDSAPITKISRTIEARFYTFICYRMRLKALVDILTI